MDSAVGEDGEVISAQLTRAPLPMHLCEVGVCTTTEDYRPGAVGLPARGYVLAVPRRPLKHRGITKVMTALAYHARPVNFHRTPPAPVRAHQTARSEPPAGPPAAPGR